MTDQILLEKGHAQGDSPSPLLYNLAVQILLFKIELDPEVEFIFPKTFGPGIIKPNGQFVNEINQETDKTDCFADDNNTITVLSYNSLNKIKLILEHLKF